jgi:hypothetical protein
MGESQCSEETGFYRKGDTYCTHPMCVADRMGVPTPFNAIGRGDRSNAVEGGASSHRMSEGDGAGLEIQRRRMKEGSDQMEEEDIICTGHDIEREQAAEEAENEAENEAAAERQFFEAAASADTFSLEGHDEALLSIPELRR